MENTQDYVKRVLKALIYIEDHFDEEITLEQLAKAASYSAFHFHRIFEAIVGETTHKYIRRLRLEKAAGKLRYTGQPITEIALDANYDTSSAFTRAFKQCMGQSPRNYRALYKEINAMNKKISELPMIQPDKVEKIDNLKLLFIRRTGNYAESSESAWEAMLAFIHENKLDKTKLRYISISHDNPEITSEDKLRFDACIQTQEKVPEKGDVGTEVLKGGKYAVFTHPGAVNAMQETFDRIFFRWLPNNPVIFDEARSVFCEHFNLQFMHCDESKLITKIYIPIS